ncbi:putative Phytocyanin domain, cupredoxin [Helianthus annuus]|uniref:Basic blue protein n=1 Tax=Helianthus annuus TaxID=4232 RepID=A0A251TAZ5_HELAN|nr:basic blue protein [Helianthus annuus]XP_021991666.1 basic blue protein [Helianthus annuus]KAF5781694.1 putative Phytocyanin domain, cupredoxin [Helianthus annuus]KAF5781696.1 putative Phytocyanin domain, cupredoxin [Helianthus annuus]KAJ0501269.1 putative Phytocyanin domain, cupredoxin [Helianthus annuus]KAJ0501272.1 putative Phytocyanin domain, cupredoxin [Helianthus annuus]KAJ0501277.1 putative Phytocyanin domain, cupredoxin [Helianthus annuus]
MAEGRGSVVVSMVVLCLLVVAFQCEVAQAATYVVGDDNGWTFSVAGWENGKNFNAGDVLVFNYPQGAHNVVVVNKESYDGCNTTPSEAKVYTSGNDQITLVKGYNNFICSYFGHCDSGMKIQIFVS